MTRTAELTVKLLDGTLTDVEGAELDALVASDPTAEEEYLTLLELEAELRALRTGFDLTDTTLAKIQQAQAERTAGAVLAQIAQAPTPSWAARVAESAPPRRLSATRFRIAGLATCAAALILALWLHGLKPAPTPPDGDPEPTAFAKLSSMAGSVELVTPSGEAIHAQEGGELPAGFTLRTVGDDSHAVVELLHDRTRVEIESDSVVRFAGTAGAGKPRLFLASGQLTAAVPGRPDDQPLVVATAVAEVFARESIFVVSSAGPDSARVDIKRGKVELARTAAPKRVPLGAGRAAVVFGALDRLDIEPAPAVDRSPKRTLAFPGPRDIAFSPDGSEIWVANARLFTRWLPSGGTKETSFYPRRGNDGVAAFTRDRKYLLAFRGEREERVLVRSLPDGGEHGAIDARLQEPRFWTAAPDASWLAVVDPRPNNKRVRVFDGEQGEELFAHGTDDAIACVAASPDGASLALGTLATGRGASNKVVFLDAATGERLHALSVLKRPLTALAFSPDGRFLAVGFNGTIQLWDLRTRELARSVTGFERVPLSLAFAPDGKRLAAGTADGHVWLWEVESGRHTQLIELGGRGVRAIAFSPDGKQLVAAANSAPISVWDVADRPHTLPNFQ